MLFYFSQAKQKWKKKNKWSRQAHFLSNSIPDSFLLDPFALCCSCVWVKGEPACRLRLSWSDSLNSKYFSYLQEKSWRALPEGISPTSTTTEPTSLPLLYINRLTLGCHYLSCIGSISWGRGLQKCQNNFVTIITKKLSTSQVISTCPKVLLSSVWWGHWSSKQADVEVVACTTCLLCS